jgi:hypothetical protein
MTPFLTPRTERPRADAQVCGCGLQVKNFCAHFSLRRVFFSDLTPGMHCPEIRLNTESAETATTVRTLRRAPRFSSSEGGTRNLSGHPLEHNGNIVAGGNAVTDGSFAESKTMRPDLFLAAWLKRLLSGPEKLNKCLRWTTPFPCAQSAVPADGAAAASRRQIRSRTSALARDTRTMWFHANYVSSSVSGDYYQAMFEAEEDTNDPNSPYLLIQRQFETSNGGRCYIETHDEKYIGHFLLRRVEFTPERLSIEFDRPSDNLVSVTFNMAVPDFEEASQVIKIISGEVDLQ